MIKYLNYIPINNKIKKNNLLFFIFIILFVVLLVIVKADLVGSLSLIFTALITFYFSRYYKSLSTILYVALCLRLITIFFGNFLVILPDSWGDATKFERVAWEMSQNGFFFWLKFVFLLRKLFAIQLQLCFVYPQSFSKKVLILAQIDEAYLQNF